MDIREMLEKCKPFAPVVSAAVVAACVAGSLYGYKVPVYETKASVEDTQEQEDEVPVVKTSTEEETKEDEAAEEEEQAKGSFDLEDGVYQGSGTGYRGNITVAVTIKDKQITSIEILSASDDEPFFGRAKGLIDQIIKKQSTKVDTVSGATYSSKGIISAVKNALTGEKDSGTTGSSQEGTSTSQSKSTPEAVGSVQEPSAYKDGTYYGTGTGFAGNLKVEVVITGGKISNIQIVETNDGSEYIQKASGVINQILGAQSTNGIDTVSGATFSSNGIIKAVRNALSQAAATESVAAENGGNAGSDGTNTENKENTENNTTAVNGTLPYNEGVYYGTAEGYNGDITVAVVIQEKTLKAVLVIGEEDDDVFFGRAMDVVTQMMKKQSTEVDTVSGATYSSKGLIQAVQNALKEAGTSETAENGSDDKAADKAEFISAGRFRNLVDGVYTGSADAFRGDVEVQVTVENQQVTDISIFSYCDTEEYFFKAAPVVIEEMKEEQSLNIDAVSGATYSSNGIIHAVANALEIPEDQYAERPGRNLAAKKKSHGHIVKHVIENQEEYEKKVKEYEK